MSGDSKHEAEEEVEVVVRFVIPAGKTEVTVSDSLSLAYQKSLDSGLAPVWVEEEEVTGLRPTKTDVFVLDPFTGPAFEHVTSSQEFKSTVVGKSSLLPACSSLPL